MDIKLTEQLIPGSLPMPEQHKAETAPLAFVSLVTDAAAECALPRQDVTAAVAGEAVAPAPGGSAPGDVAAGNLWRVMTPPPAEDAPEEESPPAGDRVVRKRPATGYPKPWK